MTTRLKMTAAFVPVVTSMFLPANMVRGAVIISISNLKVPGGTTAEVGVYASSTSGDIISGFNLPLDINDDGDNTVPPTGFKLDATPLQNTVYGNTGFDTPMPQISLIGVDGIPTGTGANIQLSSTPTLLFDLAIDVSPTAVVGSVLPLEIEAPASPFNSLFNIAGPSTPTVSAPTTGTPVLGSVTVIAVPESASSGAVCLAGLVGLRFASGRARKRRSLPTTL